MNNKDGDKSFDSTTGSSLFINSGRISAQVKDIQGGSIDKAVKCVSLHTFYFQTFILFRTLHRIKANSFSPNQLQFVLFLIKQLQPFLQTLPKTEFLFHSSFHTTILSPSKYREKISADHLYDPHSRHWGW